MLKRLKQLIVILACLFAGQAQAQDTLLLEARTSPKAIVIKWTPYQPAVWAALLKTGYRVERSEMTNGVSGNTVVLAAKVLPKDAVWFQLHAKEVDGLMEPIGALLYDTTFQFPKTEDLDPIDMRYNYVLNEAQNSDLIAVATGVMITDSTAVPGKSYRYVVSALGEPAARGQVDITFREYALATYPSNKIMEFRFPNDLSLSQMRNPQPPVLPSVLGVAKAYGDSIVLRWGPNSARLWSESNRRGYIVERIRNSDGDTKQLAIVKPWRQDTLAGLIDSDSIAMLAAAQLYSTAGAETAEGFADLAALAENKWSFALYAAERSPLAADLLGLRYVDRDVKKGENYSYMIKSLAVPSIFAAALITISNEYVPIAEPSELSLETGDKVLTVHWNKSQNERNFSSYKLERSDDNGKNWRQLTESLLVFVEDPEYPLQDFTFRDSVGENYKTFRYRLSGLTAFGDFSKYAEVKGQAIDLTPPPMPQITEVIFKDTLQQAIIRWDGGELPNDFDGYFVTLSDQTEGGHVDTISTKLGADKKEFIYKPKGGFSGEEAHYFHIISRDKRGNAITSVESYMHVPDLIAPPPPDTVIGQIAEDGSVSISWSHSKAKDVIGYWVYFANDPKEEFSLINKEMLEINTFKTKVEEVSLNKAAYYMIAAEDKSNNRGNTSKILKLRRPDKVPPIKPGFFTPVHAPGAIMVKWTKSPSDDVARYHVYRRLYGSDEPWVKTGILNSVDSVVLADTAVVMDVLYDYKIQAEDESGNLSEETLNFSARLPFEPEKVKVSDFTAAPGSDKQSAKLKWRFSAPTKAMPPGQSWEYYLLRSEGSKNVEYLAKSDSNTFEYTDTGLKPGVLYNYAVQVHFANGQSGVTCPVKSVLINP